jgi:CheY-like chemotaxis protein
MKILFLDDMKSRRDVFQKNAVGHSVDFAITAQEAIAFLKNNEYDVIYLDHDLEDSHYQSNEDHHEDGRFVANHLKDMTQHHGKIVIVHSLNPIGRANIASILDKDFDVWMPENIRISELWKIEANTLIGAIHLFNSKR